MADLLTFLEETFPGRKIDYVNLSRSPHITWDIVKANPDRPWVYWALSENPNITWKIVKNNPDKPWDYYHLGKNPNITWDIIQANPATPWDYDFISSNRNITWDIVHANPDKPWRYDLLSRHIVIPDYAFDDKELLQPFREYIWSNPSVTLDKIERLKRSLTYVNFNNFEMNPNVTWDYARTHIANNYRSYAFLEYNPNITWDIVAANKDKPWVYHNLFHNPNIDWDIILKNEELKKWLLGNDNCFGSALLNPMPGFFEKRRAIARCKALKEDLMKAVFHPDRASAYWLD